MQQSDAEQYSFEQSYQTEDGLYAAADIIYKNENGTIDIYEVKSSGSIDNDHLIDAAFQTILLRNRVTKLDRFISFILIKIT